MSDTSREAFDVYWRARQLRTHRYADRECPEDWGLAFKADAEAAWQASRAAAMEEAAKVCEDMRDLKEAKDANDRVIAALERGDDRDSLSRLRHQSTVSLFNGALERAAKGIRACAAVETSIQTPSIDASSGRVDSIDAEG